MIQPFTNMTYPPNSIRRFNINWANVPMEHIETWEEFNDLLDKLEANGVERTETHSHVLITSTEYLRNKYFMQFYRNGATVRWFEYRPAQLWGMPRQATMGTTELISPEVTGYRSFYKVLNQFQKLYKVKFEEVFGSSDGMDLWSRIRRCIPRPVNFGKGANRILDSVYKADVSSAYAFEGAKKLPTLQGAVKKRGRIAPTAEYPFVFYLSSHHLAILDELDTTEFEQYADWYDTKEMYQTVKCDVSLCCKAAPYSLAPIFTHYYEGRNEHPEYKQYMNLFVGYCYREVRPEFSHVAAVILARSAMRILRYAQKIWDAGNTVRLIATDSVLWQGSPVDFTAKTKSFGCFLQEYENIQAVVMGPKKYQLLTDQGETITRWAGVKRELVEDMSFGDIITSDLRPSVCQWNGKRFIISEGDFYDAV